MLVNVYDQAGTEMETWQENSEEEAVFDASSRRSSSY
jgi:hypothetical protein